jgi:hypothetical protein
MQSDGRIIAEINSYLYLFCMNTTFFLVYCFLPIEFPRVSTVEEAVQQALFWFIPSAICGWIAYQAKRDDLLGCLIISLPIGRHWQRNDIFGIYRCDSSQVSISVDD